MNDLRDIRAALRNCKIMFHEIQMEFIRIKKEGRDPFEDPIFKNLVKYTGDHLDAIKFDLQSQGMYQNEHQGDLNEEKITNCSVFADPKRDEVSSSESPSGSTYLRDRADEEGPDSPHID